MESINELLEKCEKYNPNVPWRERIARGLSIRITWVFLWWNEKREELKRRNQEYEKEN